MYRGIIYVQSTEMEGSSARSYTKICSQVIREKSLIKHKVIDFDSIDFVLERDVKSPHVHTTYTKK